MESLTKCVLLLGVLTQCSLAEEDPIVKLPTGQIRGYKDQTQHGNLTHYVYAQIPFAEPPIGNLRFKSPKPVKAWEGVLDCKETTKICRQLGENSMENEDCLYVNIYTSIAPNQTASLPVMFYIYGGGFVNGASTVNRNKAQFFLEQGVVVVEISYRVGAYGFLTTTDSVIPGNFGLKDQNLALKWVQENIHLFGGDPEKVTIFGQSAGSASVTYQILSTKSKGLFRGAIGQSGSALCPWAYQRHAKDIAYQAAKYLDPNFTTDRTSEELLEFLQGVDAEALDDASNHVVWVGEEIVQGFRFAPIIEQEHEEAFLTESMYDLVSNGKINNVTLMMGLCSEESIYSGGDLNGFKNKVAYYEEHMETLVPEDFHVKDLNDQISLAKKIRSIYANGLLTENLAGAIRYFSDTSFSRAIIHYANLQAKFGDVYFYQFSYHGALGGNNIYVPGADRVGHSEDVNYLWLSDSNRASDEDLLTVKRYTKLFTDFAKTLNPTPEPSDLMQNVNLPKITDGSFYYININDTLEVKLACKGEAYKKWVKLYDDFAVPPYDTY